MPKSRHLLTAALVCGAASACCSPPSRIGGAPATAPAPSAVWDAKRAPESAAPFNSTEQQRATRGTVIPPDVATRMDHLTIGDVVDLSLGNSPQTRVTWAEARAAAAAYGSARGHLLPSLELDGSGVPSQAVSFS